MKKENKTSSWLLLREDLNTIQQKIKDLQSAIRGVEGKLVEIESQEESVTLRHVSRATRALREGASQEEILDTLLDQALGYVDRGILFLKEDEVFRPLKFSEFPVDLTQLEIDDPDDPVARSATHKAIVEVEDPTREKFPWLDENLKSGSSAVCIPLLFSGSSRLVFYGDSKDPIDVNGLELLLQLGAMVLQNHYLTVMNSGTWEPAKSERWPTLEEREPISGEEGLDSGVEEEIEETDKEKAEELINDVGKSTPPVIQSRQRASEEGELQIGELDEGSETEDTESGLEEEDEALKNEFLEAMRAEQERGDEEEFAFEDVDLEDVERGQPEPDAQEVTDEEDEVDPDLENSFSDFEFPNEEGRRLIIDFDEEEEEKEPVQEEEEEEEIEIDWEDTAVFSDAEEEEEGLETPPEVDLIETESAEEIEGPATHEEPEAAEETTIDSEEEETIHADAKRFARLLVTEIKLYHEQEVEDGREEADLYIRLKRDIDRSREMYEKRADPRVKEQTDYFHEELVRILAHEDPSLMGPDYPGQRIGGSES